LTATNVAAKNAKLLQKVFFTAKKLLLHVVGISAVAKSFTTTINIAAITNVLQQQLMSLTKQVVLATINVAGITSVFFCNNNYCRGQKMCFSQQKIVFQGQLTSLP
jgi:hypothetical protein